MRRIWAAFAAVLFWAGPDLAQTTFATVTGSVTDPSGLPLAGANVEALQVESGYRYSAQSNESGVFTLANLREGNYTVTVGATGFKAFRLDGVQLVSRDVRRLDVKMEIGEVSTTIEVVSTGAAVIETETARISQSRTAEELKDLPLNTRSVTSFLALVPGVGQATTVTATYRFAAVGATSRNSRSTVSVT
jgi:hypothetical protein